MVEISPHGMQRATKRALGILLIAGAMYHAGWAETMQPANITTNDTGGTTPISLVRGRVSNQPSHYILGPGDKVSIKVELTTEFNQSFTIRPDGYATIYPFGEVNISGMDIPGLSSLLSEKYKFYLLNPKVTVDVEEMRPALVYITGAVNKPGTYQFIREGYGNTGQSNSATDKVEITLSNVLAKAGGLNQWADIDHIEVIHQTTGQTETFNLRDFLSQGGTQDIWLLPEDKVNVPELKTAMDPETFQLISRSTFYKGKFPVVVLGAVRNQGEVQLDPNNNSLNAALALAGGFVSDLSKRTAFIVQRPSNNGGFNRFVVDGKKIQFALQPGDVVYVADSQLSKIEHGLRILSTLTLPVFYGINSGVGVNTLINRN